MRGKNAYSAHAARPAVPVASSRGRTVSAGPSSMAGESKRAARDEETAMNAMAPKTRASPPTRTVVMGFTGPSDRGRLTRSGLTSLSGYKPVCSQPGAIAIPRSGAEVAAAPLDHRSAPRSPPVLRCGGTSCLTPNGESSSSIRSLAAEPRTGWDSNPRYPCGYTGFRDRPFQPLTHLSELLDAETPRCADA